MKDLLHKESKDTFAILLILLTNFNEFISSSSDNDDDENSAAGGLDPRTGRIRKKCGPQLGMKREPLVPTQMDVEEKATIEHLRSLKLIRRVAPGKSYV